MRVAGIRSAGDAVETIDVPDQRPLAAHEVLIEVKAAGVGNWDDVVRQGPVPALTATQVLNEPVAIRPGETLIVNGAGA
jgi:NADPH:quinone reductase-like Zn-dependent oxidoreductase